MQVPISNDMFPSILHRVIDETLQTFHIPGAAIAIIEGEQVQAKAFGVAELPSTPVTTDTLFYIGSITKSFLGTTTTRYIASKANQYSKAKIAFTTPIKTVVGDDFVIPDQWAESHITIEDALSHRTGSSRHDNAYGGPIDTPKAVTRLLRHLPWNTELRSAYEYCNIMFIAATHALETAAGEPFDKLLRKYITEPLCMKDTHASRSEALKHTNGTTKLYRGYSWEGDWSNPKDKDKHTEHVYGSDAGLIGAAGCIISNVHDMAKYVQALLGQGGILDQDIRDEVMKPRTVMGKNAFDNSYAHYALGLWRYYYQGTEIVQHTGDVIGYSSLMAFIPAKNWGFVYLGNGDFGSMAATRILFHLVDNMMGTAPADRFDPTPSNLEVIRSFTRKDPDIAKKHFSSVPNPPLPPSLPLEKYTGHFYNAGYRNIRFQLARSSGSDGSEAREYLVSKLEDRGNVVILQLFHVSAEYWVGYKLRGEVEVLGQGVQEVKAVARVGVAGDVEAWGISVEVGLIRDNWRDTLVCFDRVGDTA